ncbi:hypothetical protein K439DRAFT_1663007 [Ramaria rubella]|nr:hypothetical protein K439DRAFT_1663007 [Ramaria rubella]
MFKFTFSSESVGSNPFAATATEQDRTQRTSVTRTIPRKLPQPPKRPLPPPSASEDINDIPSSKKRGWAPTSSSASAPTSQATLTNGWIDTPSRYLEAASQSHRGGSEEDVDAELPPAKRRKTFTDSIISTAFSAALIGTAVGMTAYRMWRDRGRPKEEPDSELIEPPPPYQREEWVDDMPQRKPAPHSPKHARRPRPVPRRVPRHRVAPVTKSSTQLSHFNSSSSRLSVVQSSESKDQECDLEDQMDWMGDKIRHLIEEGQKALGKEIVIMDDAPSNEGGVVDDGMDGWEEEDSQKAHPTSPTPSNSRRSKRAHRSPNISIAVLPVSSAVSPTSHGMPTSPRLKLSRAGTASSQSRPASTSPYLGVSGITRLRSKSSAGMEDVKVIFETQAISPTPGVPSVNHFEDEDSRALAERMENIRKAYNIH